MTQRTNRLVIQTPEGISFPLLLASPLHRFLAYTLDLFCILSIVKTISTILCLLSVLSEDLANALFILSFFMVSIGYSILLEWFWNGQTVGKRMLKLRVVDIHGLKLNPSQIILRNLFRCVDSLPIFYLVGGVSSLLSSRYQRLGDLAANTVVIRVRSSPEPDLDKIGQEKYNSLRKYPHLIARLRQRLSAEEAGLALQAVLRREELQSEARVKVFKELSDFFQGKAEFPQEIMEGLSDEQYVRNIVEILFRPKNQISTT